MSRASLIEIDAIKSLANDVMRKAAAPGEPIPAGVITGAGAGAPPPMDPSMMGGAPPMDPSMMSGAPPMDPAMMGGAPPMDPAMAAGGVPPDPMAAGMLPGNPPIDPAAAQGLPPGTPMPEDPAAAGDPAAGAMGGAPATEESLKALIEIGNRMLSVLTLIATHLEANKKLTDAVSKPLPGAASASGSKKTAEIAPPQGYEPVDAVGTPSIAGEQIAWQDEIRKTASAAQKLLLIRKGAG